MLNYKILWFSLILMFSSCKPRSLFTLSDINLTKSDLIYNYHEPSAGEEEFTLRFYKFTDQHKSSLFAKKTKLDQLKFPLDYTEVDWNTTPLNDDQQSGILELISKYGAKDIVSKEKRLLLISKLLKPNSILTYGYKSGGKSVYALKLYLIDFEESLLIECIIIT